MNQTPQQIAVDYSDFDYGDALARWFATEAYRITDTARLVHETGERLVAAGIPLYRLSYFQRALHPERVGTGYFWRRGRGIEASHAPNTTFESSEYRDNPLPAVFEERKSIRVRLEQATPAFPVLRQLQQEGATDYVAMPLIFGDGHIDGLSVTSDRPGGFSRADLDRMYALHFLFTRIVETHSLRSTAITLLDTYVGHDAGAKILEGRIRRGDGDSIQAVLWYCDLRDFTSLSDRLPRQALLDLLNDYFECMAAPIAAQGGTVLKFIGDAMLAIFPIVTGAPAASVCARALLAARTAVREAETLNDARRRSGKPCMSFGLALHVGEVMYGNIGAPGRLDFTVIGPAVNLVTRIEPLCQQLGVRTLVSQAFASLVGDAVRSLGPQHLRGVARPHEVFAPVD